MHRVLKSISGMASIAVLGLATAFVPGIVSQASAQQPAAKEKKVKDQGEYDVFTAVTKETDNTKKLQLLEQWKQKYPDSDYKMDRLLYQLAANQALSNVNGIRSTAKEILALDPKDLNAQYWIARLTLASTDAPALAEGEKAANGLLSAEKPEVVKADAWPAAKKDLDIMALRVLGHIAQQRKNYDEEVKQLTKYLELNPTDAQVSNLIGAALILMKKVEVYPQAFFHFARAAVYEGTGALPPADRTKMDAYLTKIYTNFHGPDEAGQKTPSLAEIREMAKKSAVPPADLKVDDINKITGEKEAKFRTENPQLALWLSIKKELTTPNGEQYFESNVKGAAIPKLKAFVISSKPAVNPKEIIIGFEKPDVAEATLKLETAIKGKVNPGMIYFEGVPSAFTREPFNLTFDIIEKDKIEGLSVEAAAPVRKAPVKKGPAKKK